MDTEHPEALCEVCGSKNVSWFAPNHIWNMVGRLSDGSDLMLCPMCFIERAEKMGFDRFAWRIEPAYEQ